MRYPNYCKTFQNYPKWIERPYLKGMPSMDRRKNDHLGQKIVTYLGCLGGVCRKMSLVLQHFKNGNLQEWQLLYTKWQRGADAVMQRISAKVFHGKEVSPIPLAKLVDAPKLENQSAKARMSFLQKLRKPVAPEAVAPQRVKNQTFKVNISLWCTLSELVDGKVSLVLRYKDAEGHFACVVDSGQLAHSRDVMLSGIAEFYTKGALESATICLMGVDKKMQVSVDTLSVKTIKSESKNQRAANF